MTLTYLARLSVRCRRLRRLIKFLVIILSCCSVFYFAFILIKEDNAILASDSGGNFTDEVQNNTDVREERRTGQVTVKSDSGGNATEKV